MLILKKKNMKKITILFMLMLTVSIAMAQVQFAKKSTVLQQKEAYVFTDLTLPVQDMPLNFNDTTHEINSYAYGYLFSFTLTDTTTVSLTTDNNIPYFNLFSDNTLSNSIDQGTAITKTLNIGTYYIALYVSNYQDLTPEFTSLLSILPIDAINYTDLDYSEQLIINESKYGETNVMEANVDIVNNVANYAKGYSLDVTEGETYKISLGVFPNNSQFYGFFMILNNNLTGNINVDAIMDEEIYLSEQINHDFYYSADSTETLKLIIGGYNNENEDINFLYTLKVEELENSFVDLPTSEEFSWDTITLPFISTLYFDPDHKVMIDTTINGEDTILSFKKGFILDVPENDTINLNYLSGYNILFDWYSPLYIYTDDSLYNQITHMWEEDSYILNPGTYYLVFSDDNYYYFNSVYYSCPVNLIDNVVINENISDTLSLQELLDDPNITEVDYTTDLPFSEQKILQVDSTPIVLGQNDPEFRWEDNLFFAQAYKLTNMQVDDTVNIHIGGDQVDSYLYVYKKDANGIDYLLVQAIDDGTIEIDPAFPNGYYDSYVEFIAPEACDYYIVATTYSEYNSDMNGRGISTTIWNGTIDDEPEITYPILGTLVSTTASETTIHFNLEESNVTDLDRKFSLLSLTVTGTLSDNNSLLVDNTPYTWSINTYDASYIIAPSYFILDVNYSPAVVEFTYLTIGINETANSSISLYPNPASNYIKIDGLDGQEQISIIDNSGRIVKSLNANEAIQTISINDLSQGAYLVTIRKENKIEVLKFIK